MVVLDEPGTDIGLLGKRPFIEALEKESPVIAEHLRLQYEDFGKLGGNDVHPLYPNSER
jgi:hypothetical protein